MSVSSLAAPELRYSKGDPRSGKPSQEEEIQFAAVQKHPTEWGQRKSKSCLVVPSWKDKIACSLGWLRTEGKD